MKSVAVLVTNVSAWLLAFALGTAMAYAAPVSLVGWKFAPASDLVKSWGETPVIATVIGSQLPTSDCVVMNAHKSITLDSTGRSAHNGMWLFDLNCNLAVAKAGKPGASVVTPGGAEAKKVEGYIEVWNSGDVSGCGASADAVKWCQQQCDKYGGCSADVENYLASHS